MGMEAWISAGTLGDLTRDHKLHERKGTQEHRPFLSNKTERCGVDGGHLPIGMEEFSRKACVDDVRAPEDFDELVPKWLALGRPEDTHEDLAKLAAAIGVKGGLVSTTVSEANWG